MGAGVSAEQFKGKSREELLTLCFKHVDRYNEDKASLGNLMCMADDLSPAEIEQVRSDFVRIDRHGNGYILREDYADYYIKQLADVDDDEFRMFVQSVLNSAHWPERQLKKNKQEYTFWDYMAGSWPKNYGMRIDHFLVSDNLLENIKTININSKPRGKTKPSDHTPIELEII